MWYEIFLFEIRYRLRRPETYVYFLFLLLFSLGSVDFIFQGIDLGSVHKNAPIVIGKTMGAVSAISMIIASLIMGIPVIRDHQYDMESLLYVNPISKLDYLLGRFMGSFAILLFAFSGLLLGSMLGEFMPWHNPEDMMPFRPMSYLITYVEIVIPILFLGGSLFFVTGALTKKNMVVYTQAIVLFVFFILTKSITNLFLQGLLDPYSLTSLTQVTESWDSVQRNEQLIPFTGILLWNKLFWTAISFIILSYGYRKFSLTLHAPARKYKKKTHKDNHPEEVSIADIPLPAINTQGGLKASINQVGHLSWFYFTSIATQVSFLALLFCSAMIILINSINLGTVYGVNSYPKAYFIIEELQEMSSYFFVIVLLFYSGEIIWKEKDINFKSIYDATPISDFSHLISKYIGLSMIYIVMILSLIFYGVIFQLMNGYFTFDISVFFQGFFMEVFPFLMLYSIASFFFQAISNRKVIGIILTLVFCICVLLLHSLGIGDGLYTYAGGFLGTYSDMNGYAQGVIPYLLIKTYWFVFGGMVLIASSAIISRGAETSVMHRVKYMGSRISKSMRYAGLILLLVFTVMGCSIYYNTHVLNTYWSENDKQSYRFKYEDSLREFKNNNQPFIRDVTLDVDLYPRGNSYSIRGTYKMYNPHKTAIHAIHIQKYLNDHVAIDTLYFDQKNINQSEHIELGYYIFNLDQPLLPGDTIQMDFIQSYKSIGFEENPSIDGLLENGSFINYKHLPTIGYNDDYEIGDASTRTHLGLPPRDHIGSIEDESFVRLNRIGTDADLIHLDVKISTDSDQIPIAPGTLIEYYMEDDRVHYHYKMSQPTINFYTLLSGKYEVMRDVWQSSLQGGPVNLEIYSHPTHDYNLERMMESMKHALSYCSENFSPYPYKELRIVEFPRYANFAQAFPTVIPFSESIGFLLDIDDKKDVDMVYFITAHEAAHQWWGTQVEAAPVQGANMILETLAQYTAIMIFQQKYPQEKIDQFLDLQLELYEDEKKRHDEEPPLSLVEDQEYIYYNKGVLNMYELQEHIGEERINQALAAFLRDWNSTDGVEKIKQERYATSKDLMRYFKQVAGEHSVTLLEELFY